MSETNGRKPESGEVRSDLLARVRQEIQAGTYETPLKLAIAIERLIRDVDGRTVRSHSPAEGRG